MGLNIDAAAVEQPELLRSCMQDAFNDIAALAPPEASSKISATSSDAQTIKNRWWRRKKRAQ